MQTPQIFPQLALLSDDVRKAMEHQINDRIRRGWTVADINNWVNCTEEINPDLSEDRALGIMKRISDKYKK